MARYTDSVCRLCRREGIKLYLKGERCYTEKCAIERRAYPPGQHGQGRMKFSEYGLQLREKQKVKRIYGLLEKQFRLEFEEADRMKGVTGLNLLTLLERRLDNIVYRMGFAISRNQARQLVRHGHVLVNGKRMNIPSAKVKRGDVVSLKEKARKNLAVTAAREHAAGRGLPRWVTMSEDGCEGTVNDYPERDELTIPMQERLIVELYSK